MQLKCPFWQQAAIKIVQLIPKRAWGWLSNLLAKLLVASNIQRVKIARVNIYLCIKPCELILKQNLANSIYSIFELLTYNCNNLPQTNILSQKNFLQALNNKQGVLLVHPHTLSMNLAGAIICSYVCAHSNKKFGYIYRPAKNEKSNNILQYFRYILGPQAHWFQAKDTKACIRFLRSGGVLMTFPDHDLGKERSVFSNFCNIQTATCPAFAKMAILGQATCLPIMLYKQNNKFVFKDQKPINLNQTEQQLADWLNTWVENFVLSHPTQYFWLHKRFKTRPKNKQDFYHN